MLLSQHIESVNEQQKLQAQQRGRR
jgi:hypothetical protein